MNTTEEIVYPTQPDADGYYYDNEGEKALETETRIDDNGDIVKRIKLRGNRTAIMRELTKKDSDKAATIAGKDKNMLLAAYIAQGTVITDKDGNKVPFVAEDLAAWKSADTNRLEAAAAKLNF
jgi:hypothetical protein